MPNGEGYSLDDGLLFGLRELKLMQRMNEVARGRAGLGASVRAGLVVRRGPGGDLDSQWLVEDFDDDGTVNVRSISGAYDATTPEKAWSALDDLGVAVAYDDDGVPFTHDEAADPSDVSPPNDDSWYTLVATSELTEYARGTITVSGSVNVAGSGTRFTDFLAYAASNRATKLLIEDSTAGNNGVYEIDAITDDETLTVRTPFAALEGDLRFKLVGEFDSGTFQRSVLRRRRAGLSIITRTRKPSAGQLVLADVKRNDAGSPKVQILDRRADSLSRSGQLRVHGIDLQVHTPSGTLAAKDVLVRPATAADAVRVAPRRDGGWVIDRSDGGNTGTIIYDPTDDTWSDGGTSTGFSSGITRLVPMPPGYPYEFVAVLEQPGGLSFWGYSGTWSVITTGPIWSPAAPFVLSDVRMNRWGRLYVLGTYDVTGTPSVRYIYSDDYGETWVTNGTAGFEVVASGVNASGFPSLGFLADGSAVVCWDTGSNLKFYRSTDDTSIDPDDPAGTADHHTTTYSGDGLCDVVPLPDGSFLIYDRDVDPTGGGVDNFTVQRWGIRDRNQVELIESIPLIKTAAAALGGLCAAGYHPLTNELIAIYNDGDQRAVSHRLRLSDQPA